MTYYHSPRTRQLIASVATAVCPKVPSPGELIPEIAHHTEMSLRAFPTPARLALLTGLRTYDEGARLFPPSRGRSARSLEGEVAERYFASWWRSPLELQRTFAKGLKGIVCLAYYETAPVKAHIGYTPEAWIEKVTKRRLAVYSADIERQAAAILAPDPLPSLAPEIE